MTDRELVDSAKKARDNSYSPYSEYPVGAALLTKGGKIYTGCNVENSSFSLTCCAERVALFKAVSEGEREFTKIAVVSSEKEPILPCGTCRQALYEFAPNLSIIVLHDNEIKTFLLKELLPEGFKLEKGNRK